jgi:hypothetical protein
MLQNIVIGCVLVILTTLNHAGVMVLTIKGLRLTHADHWARKSHWGRSAIVASLVLIMFVASVIESIMWAATYLMFGVISGLEQALYFSMVTYTTLGYGDVVIEDHWRLLASLEAANGIIMFGWTTALIFAAVHSVYFRTDSDHKSHG